MKPCLLKLKVVMTTLLLALPLLAIGNTVKVFDLNIDNVYNMYIDSPDSANGELIFCFQTSDKLIKTNLQGEVIEITDNPYRYFTVLNGDTLILKDHTVFDTNGDTIVDYYGIRGSYQFIAASSSGIFVFQNVNVNGASSSVHDFLSQKIIFNASNLKGLCCSGGVVYGIKPQSVETFPSLLTWRNADDLNSSCYQMPLQIKDPRGIAEYGNYLYIFSNADKALYKMERPLPQDQTVTESGADSLKIGSDTISYCEPGIDFTLPKRTVMTQNDIDTVVLYSLVTDLYIEKREDVAQRDIETLVKQYLPDARFKWSSGPYNYMCNVTTNSTGLDEAIKALTDDDAIVCVSKRYIRKDVKDLLDLYPFSSDVETYAFANKLNVCYLDEETWEKADELIASLGLDFGDIWDGNSIYYKTANLIAPKTMNVVSVANYLNESGYFLYARPIAISGGRKKCQIKSIDLSDTPSYYAWPEGTKKYLYVTPDGFAVRKMPETEKTHFESVIRTYAGGSRSRINWINEESCIVKTAPEFVEKAMEALANNDDVRWVSKKYLDNDFYVQSIKYGERLTYWGLDGRLIIIFKDDISDAVKNRIVNDYNLNLVCNDSIRMEHTVYYSVYELSKGADILSVCNNIIETGYVQSAEPNIIKEKEITIVYPFSPTNNVKVKTDYAQETGVQYYDLLGRRIDAPSGLTIEVKRYSDGSVRTQKILFK